MLLCKGISGIAQTVTQKVKGDDCRDNEDGWGKNPWLLQENTDVLRIMLETCIRTCELCADECARHEHKHCQLCAEMCRECARDCREALIALNEEVHEEA